MMRTSRSIAAQAIQSGRVEVNHVPLRTTHEDVFEGDIFTVRGVGRYRLVAIGGKSRKGSSVHTPFTNIERRIARSAAGRE